MQSNNPSNLPPSEGDASATRVGDLSAMLRVMQPLNLQMPDPILGRRRLLADLCRFIGVKVGAFQPESLGISPQSPPVASNDSNAPQIVDDLSPRQKQTLQHLLAGDSEKQVARKLGLSQHTVHGYVKALYRRYGVSTRAELLAKHLKT
jgi:DNA-binding CsgD family transcriptional regulator